MSKTTIHRNIPLFPPEPFEVQREESSSDGGWDFEGQDTQYSTHGLHTYVAAMIPQLSRKLIEAYVPAGGTVLDPFCGGGSVLVETIRSGRDAAGCDINHLAVLISKAKTTFIESEIIREASRSVMAEANGYSGVQMSFSKSDYVDFWFKPYMMLPLTALKNAIDKLEDEKIRVLFQVLFSATVRSVSLTYRNEVRLRRMTPETATNFNPDVFQVFQSKVDVAKDRIPQLPSESHARVQKADVSNLPFDENELTAVICSPPYGDERNGVNYTQFSKNMLHWLGYTKHAIRQSKDRTLGWGKAKRVKPPSSTLLETLQKIEDNPTACKEATSFYADYFEALHQLARVARERVIIVIGNRVLHKTIVDNAQITTELMSAIGIPLETVHYRKLPTKRLPKMREFGAAIDREAILVFRK